jgi:hypothetical protein
VNCARQATNVRSHLDVMAQENKAPECGESIRDGSLAELIGGLAALVGVLLGLAWIFFSLRIYVKAFLTKGWGVDDLLLIVGVVSSLNGFNPACPSASRI